MRGADGLHLAREGEYVFPACFIRIFERIGMRIFRYEKFATFETDTTENLNDRRKILNIIHRFSQFDVSEIARRF